MRSILLTFFLFIFSISLFSQEDLTLEEAISIALNRNSILLQTKNNIEVYESNLKTAYGNFLPSINANGRWSWSRSEDEGTTYNFNGIVITTPPSITENRNYDASVSSSWVLFDGLSNFANLSRAQNNLEAAEFSLNRVKQDIIFQTISLYNLVINAQQLLKVAEENVTWNQKNLEMVTERNRLGAVTLADVYAQQVRAGNAELDRIRALNTLETNKSNLLYYLGLNVLDNFTFSDSLTSMEIEMIDEDISANYANLSEMVEQALKERPDYRSAQLTLESSYDAVRVARGGHFPILSNNVSFNSSANTFDNLFKNKNYSVGLNLSIPIFAGFSIENQVQVAEVQAKNNEILLSDLERDIKRNIQTTYLNLQAAKKGLEVSRRNVIAAEENMKIEQEKYALGSGTILNVLIANSEYTSAQTNYYNQQFEFIVLSEQLKYHLGTLDYKRFE